MTGLVQQTVQIVVRWRSHNLTLFVIFSLHKAVYPYLLKARCGGITELYAAQLGHMGGYMFNRVATPSWEDCNTESTLKKYAKNIVNELKEKENQKLYVLLETGKNKCSLKSCDNKATTYRWLPFDSQSNEPEWEECILCDEHAKDWDARHLRVNDAKK